MFSGSSFLTAILPISWDVHVRQKSKMAAKLPEVPITLLVLQIHVVPKNNTWVYGHVRNIQISSNHGRCYIMSKIQDGGQPTGSSNISETRKHIIKISTATAMFSGSTFLAVVPPISSDVDVCYRSKMAAKILEIIITLLVLRYTCFKNNTEVYDYVRNI